MLTPGSSRSRGVLFDRDSDAAEMQNLASDPGHAKQQRALDERLVALMKQHGDDWRFNSSELVEEGAGSTGTRRSTHSTNIVRGPRLTLIRPNEVSLAIAQHHR